jgi:hypothetical protein
MEQDKTAKSTYGKRPLWQWLAAYLIVGGAVYAAIYYFYDHKSAHGYNTNVQSTTSAPASQSAPPAAGAATPAPTPMQQSNNYKW